MQVPFNSIGPLFLTRFKWNLSDDNLISVTNNTSVVGAQWTEAARSKGGSQDAAPTNTNY